MSSASPNSSALRLTSVQKVYGTTMALDDVSLSVPHGSYVVVVGASGSGKTSLLNAIAGLIQVDAGSVEINDTDVTTTPPHQRPTATLFQSYALFPHMTVHENVAFGLRERRLSTVDRSSRVKDVLSLVGLSNIESRKPDQLSGGQQQRVALARSLAVDPQVLLLDEPLSALDFELRRQMRRELHRIQRQSGVTFVHVTHDREEALSLADVLVVMGHGRVLQAGERGAIESAPSTVHVARMLGYENVLQAKGNSHQRLVVRPESIRLHEGEQSAVVRDIVVTGGWQEVHLETSDGEHLIQRSTQPDDDLTVDQRVCYLIPDSAVKTVAVDAD